MSVSSPFAPSTEMLVSDVKAAAVTPLRSIVFASSLPSTTIDCTRNAGTVPRLVTGANAAPAVLASTSTLPATAVTRMLSWP